MEKNERRESCDVVCCPQDKGFLKWRLKTTCRSCLFWLFVVYSNEMTVILSQSQAQQRDSQVSCSDWCQMKFSGVLFIT